MGTKKYKPTTPGRRHRRVNDHQQITMDKPEKALLLNVSKKAGRNNTGKVTVRSRGGGNKRKYRVVDFTRTKTNVQGVVSSIEYDPFRSSYISLIKYSDGQKSYILTPLKLNVGDVIKSGDQTDFQPGNAMSLRNIPLSTAIHNIQLQRNCKAQMVRSAGCFAVITGRRDNYVTVKLPSGEVRLVHGDCYATIGQVSNTDNRNTNDGKAGASRWRRRRPSVRGAAMNACDHPHGGGEGKAPVGQSSPRSPWGKPTLGYKTRKKKKKSKKYILNKSKRGA